jgi:hydroxymethylpyrimidine pyrophosphatase-like HAD family hydrolase
MKTVAFDFDGVIAEYDGWKGVDVFGSPNLEVIKAMQKLARKGYHIIIWTTRNETLALRLYLAKHNVSYSSINSTSHNPPYTSTKPIYHVFVDDRAVGYRGQKADKLIRTIEYVIENGAHIQETKKDGKTVV